MSYPREVMIGALVQETAWTATAQSLTAAAAIYGSYHVRKPIVVQEVSFHITTAVKDLTASVVAVEIVSNIINATPVTTSLCTMTIPNLATAQTTYYNNAFTPGLVGANSLLQFKLKTQGALGGTPAGAGYFGFYASFSPEENTNATPANAMILKTS